MDGKKTCLEKFKVKEQELNHMIGIVVKRTGMESVKPETIKIREAA